MSTLTPVCSGHAWFPLCKPCSRSAWLGSSSGVGTAHAPEAPLQRAPLRRILHSVSAFWIHALRQGTTARQSVWEMGGGGIRKVVSGSAFNTTINIILILFFLMIKCFCLVIIIIFKNIEVTYSCAYLWNHARATNCLKHCTCFCLVGSLVLFNVVDASS